MDWLLPLKNLFRNRIRSILSVFTIAGSVFVLIVFRGFTDHQIKAMEDIIVGTQFGHVQVAHQAHWHPSGEERKKIMIEKPRELRESLSQIAEIKNISLRLEGRGLISTGNISEGAALVGLDFENEKEFSMALRVWDGSIQSIEEKSIWVGGLLAQKMKLKVGDEVTLLSTTLEGVMNALDVKVQAVVVTTFEEVDRVTVFVPIQLLQSLLDTSKVDYLKIVLHSEKQTQKTLQKINKIISSDHSLKARPWNEISDFFRKVRVFYNSQNLIILAILMAIVILSIMNTVSMSVNERIGEMGTLRALGQRSSKLRSNFLMESLFMSLIGGLLGFLAAYGVTQLADYFQFMAEIPGASGEIPLLVEMTSQNVVFALSVGVSFSLLATWIPIQRASRMSIVEALRKNI